MPVQLLNPDTLSQPEVYAQLSIAEGSRLVFISGQVAHDAHGQLIGDGDLSAQAEQVYVNLNAAVTAAGGQFDDIAKLTIYIVDYEPSKMAKLGEGAVRAAERLGLDLVRPITLLGVAALGEPDLLIEIEAIAVLP
ncbi:MAG: RidA family protein [Brevibacterium sp.]|uniref:RidA family protein n=1 Tax=Pseudoclavibacter chungangensis TaxID=587635 RepID=A0A7J5BM33_9MICO|nr:MULTISPECIES: RidA family protein [Micrococcales]KAB1651762.1 RidA family protein [Pseudoclavibacter chungangensis]NYJ67555.1 enamine deaminase RidA (YjgF/YER057c/UK114 family) [Pseudoclavibacter chungangensis]